ncbi:hypothetical protein JD844_025227 [Phrynosoma platyrhinos]|uniref:Usherin n=1 Tax=Phrynosoma platyrhinos TaxID=52577 RepID=A0ABQ7SZ95_PHRPL|nr:hypothetical protein JD844_025227 [Phrynosoma platyrhinos]
MDSFPNEHYRGGGGVCDDCQHNTIGRNCEFCKDFFFRHVDADLSAVDVCKPCECNIAGTINSSQLCDKIGGQCNCKRHVSGRQCNQCQEGFYNLQQSDPGGCSPCNCNTSGTVNGAITCHPNSGQCKCKENVIGFYFSQHKVDGCSPCLCHPTGSVDEICNSHTGQCVCQDYSVAGTRCDHCRNYYYGFNAETGRCQRCNCHPAGAINGTCHPMTGQCMCKQFATGSKCDNCVLDASNLDVHNLFGCSKTPSQQPPPAGQILNSSAIRLSWNPPDSPNSNQLTYKLYRNESQIYTTEDSYPYRTQIFIDTDLFPYTFYSYHLETSNVHGSTRSAALIYRTEPGIPIGNLHLNPVIPVGPHSVSLHWTALSNDSGPIEKYVLTCISSLDLKPCGQYEGLETSATVWNLVPFTKYSFSVQACTSGGCLLSQQVAIVTAQAPPEEQEPPIIHTISSTEFVIEWAPPRKANGVIIRYELYMRRALQSDENHISPENRVFQTSGWFSPHSLLESANENALTPPLTSTNITNLEPFTEYEFRILSVNMAGSIFSNWTSERTAEAAPVFMPPPSVFPLSPYSLNVSWEKPQDNEVRGEVMGYSVNVITEQQVLPVLSQVLYIAEAHEQSYIVTGLEPYRMYYFTITLCNRIACISSEPGMGQTLPAGKEKKKTTPASKFKLSTYLSNEHHYR